MNKLILCIVFLAAAANALPTEKRDIYYSNYGTGLGLGIVNSRWLDTGLYGQKPVVLGNIVRPIEQRPIVVRPVVQQPVVLTSVVKPILQSQPLVVSGLGSTGMRVNGVLGGGNYIHV